MPSNVPTYALYGEFLSGSRTDALHHETIHERSRQYAWKIALHRHRNLVQVFLLRSAGVRIQVGEIEMVTTQGAALFVPPMVTHGFQFPAEVVGDVISFPADALGDAAPQSTRLLTDEPGSSFAQVAELVAQIARSFHTMDAQREALLTHLMQALLIYLSTGSMLFTERSNDPEMQDMTAHERQAHAFCALIEDAFHTSKTIDSYAAEIGVSSPHLTRIAKKVLGETPNELITRRRMIEAERLLRFTRHSIADVAARAGYTDPPYFNRVFKRRHGLSPGAFRKHAAA